MKIANTEINRFNFIPKHGSRNRIYILSFVVGILSGLSAYILKTTVHQTHHFLTDGFHVDRGNILYLAYPVVGIALTVLFVKFFVKDNIGHGISKILYAISKRQGRIKQHNSWSSIIASTFTIGFGGSVGAEAPIVLTGAAIGSNLGRFFKLNHKTMILLIGCGSAGAIAGIFKAPIAGLIFTLEVLMIDLTMASIIPLLISAVTAASLANFLMGDKVLFSFALKDAFALDTVPFVILLGVVTGMLSLYFTRGVMITEQKLGLLKNETSKLLVGGIVLSILIFLFPTLYGEGYTTITALLHGNSDAVVENSVFNWIAGNHYLILGYLFLILVFKVFATSITTGAGGIGGIFAPTLFMGGISGFIVAKLFNGFGFNLTESNFVLIGMAGMMAGVMHAPLTAIFLIAEITGGYALILPLMIVSVVAYITIMYFEPHSLYHKRLAQSGELITHNKDKTVLTLMKMDSVIETDLETIEADKTLGELVKVISRSHRNIYPVVDHDSRFLGIVFLDDIRNIMFRPDKYNKFIVRQLMVKPPGQASTNQSMEDIMALFETTGAWNLPVVDDGKYVGFVSKAKIFNAYRKVLVHYSDE